MQDLLLRISFAACVSTIGIMATFAWSRSHKIEITRSSPEPVARIASSANEVMRRPSQRLIWQTINRNEELYLGEAVRTASNAEAKIEFLSEGASVQLDPDSVIEIERGENGINLDFLKGNAFIRSQGEGTKITLQSGDQKIEVTNTDIAVTKKSASTPLEVEVFKGDVKVIDQGQTTAPVLPKLRVLAPRPDQPVFLDEASGNEVAFQWKPLDENYQVTLEAGATRENVKPLEGLAPASGNTGLMSAKLKPGRTYYRLVARRAMGSDAQPITSSLLKVDIRRAMAPRALEPADQSVVASPEKEKGNETKIRFSWTNESQLRGFRLELSRFPNLAGAQIIDIGNENHHEMTLSGPSGQRYWRVSGRLPGSQRMISSRVQSFVTSSKSSAPLLAAPGTSVPAPTASSLPESAKASLEPAAEPMTLAWSRTADEPLYHYKTAKPSLKISWDRGPAEATSWRVRVENSREPASVDPQWKTVTAPSLETELPEAGTYLLEAEALSSDGRVLARAPTRKIEIKQAPPPAAPAFDTASEAGLKAQKDGSAEISWNPVEEAQQYHLQLKAADGTSVKSTRTKTNRAVLSQLKPGDYQVTVQSIDALGRLGPESSPRRLFVPKVSQARAPKLKSINVK